MASRETPTIIGEAPAFLAALEQVSNLASLPRPVLVIGERGTGKELIASRLHYLSDRWDQPLVKVNCAALTESLLESELFGHEAGAFTGALRSHVGRFEQADGGTLVLDELATIPPRMQEKILRVIEYGEFERVGGSETQRVDVRIVGSTNQDLPSLAAKGQFRSDLLDRLAFEVVYVPPLRARPEDVLQLAYHFAVGITAELKRPFFAGFSAAAASTLLRYSWPGNVRELKNAVERSVHRTYDSSALVKKIVFDPFDSPYRPRKERSETDEDVEPLPEEHGPSIAFPIDMKAMVGEYEISLLEEALITAQLNQKVAAELLGLTYHQLRASLKKHDLLEVVSRRRAEERELAET